MRNTIFVVSFEVLNTPVIGYKNFALIRKILALPPDLALYCCFRITNISIPKINQLLITVLVFQNYK